MQLKFVNYFSYPCGCRCSVSSDKEKDLDIIYIDLCEKHSPLSDRNLG